MFLVMNFEFSCRIMEVMEDPTINKLTFSMGSNQASTLKALEMIVITLVETVEGARLPEIITTTSPTHP